jgi:adenylate kinase
MLGMPGVGKGTFARSICKDLKLPTFVMGDAIRALIAQESALSKEIKGIVNAGRLIDDNLALQILKAQVTGDRFLLDGFPRTQRQAELLKENGLDLDLVINLKQHEDVVVAKLLGRRVCGGCGENYNVADITTPGYSLPPKAPKKAGVCDKCQGLLSTRADDEEGVIRKRLEEYRVKTLPLETYYADRILEFHSYRGIDDTAALLAEVKSRLKA